MPTSKSKLTNRIKQFLFLLTAIAFSARAASARQSPSDQLQQAAAGQVAGSAVAHRENREPLKRYKGENGIISAKTLILGGEFRVTRSFHSEATLPSITTLKSQHRVSLVGMRDARRASRQLPSSSLNRITETV